MISTTEVLFDSVWSGFVQRPAQSTSRSRSQPLEDTGDVGQISYDPDVDYIGQDRRPNPVTPSP